MIMGLESAFGDPAIDVMPTVMVDVFRSGLTRMPPLPRVYMVSSREPPSIASLPPARRRLLSSHLALSHDERRLAFRHVAHAA